MSTLNGDPYGIRTRVTAVKGRCLNRLTNGPTILFQPNLVYLAMSYSHRGNPPTTIGAEELNFRVRHGNGCDLFAIITRQFRTTFIIVSFSKKARTFLFHFNQYNFQLNDTGIIMYHILKYSVNLFFSIYQVTFS